jgi:beta-glucosidase
MIFLMTMVFINFANAKEPIEMQDFVNHLMAQMTVEEKVGQLAQYTAEMSTTGPAIKDNYRDEIIKGHVGSIFNAYTPEFTRQLQKLAVEKSRLKIPLLFAFDVIHGHKTIFPIPLGESSSWDLKLIENSARIAATEAAADGIHWAFAPMVDISRDPRWGRVAEGAGEDTWLGAKIAAARVHGLQGRELGSLDSVMACVKHFAAYGAVTGGREYNSVQLTERELYEDYLPPFEAAVAAGAASLMPSFNDIGGVPSTANKTLLRKVLREKWNFKGIVDSDYTAVNELVAHGVAKDEKQAAELAIRAGVDMDMQGGSFMKYLPTLMKEKKVSKTLVDQAVRRILEAKYQMGLFKDPYRFSDEARAQKVILSKENLEASREIARHSIVLLKNEHSILPLQKSGIIALIGPFVDDHRNLIGNWSGAGDSKKSVSLAEGITEVAGSHFKVLRSLGANILDAGILKDKMNQNGGELQTDSRTDEDLIAEAIRTAKKSDVIVLALGEAQGMSGEAASRTHIRLPENQQALLQALKQKSGKPIILVLFNGRPLVLETENKQADAILETWFLGSESGHAIADVLFGGYNPSARLTMSFPYSEGQIPLFYGSRSTGRPFNADSKYSSKYLDSPNEALFPFGFGLSYTQFTLGPPKLSSSKIKMNEHLKIKVNVTNAGARDGEETVQLYVRDLVASVSRPAKLLRGFAKVFLHKGESREVEFAIGVEDLKFYNQNMKWAAEPGLFKIMTGSNSRDLQEASFSLIR